MTEKAKTVIELYFLLLDFLFRRHPSWSSRASKVWVVGAVNIHCGTEDESRLASLNSHLILINRFQNCQKSTFYHLNDTVADTAKAIQGDESLFLKMKNRNSLKWVDYGYGRFNDSPIIYSLYTIDITSSLPSS